MIDTPWRELFPIVDTWLPGETLFSLASRHHIVSGNVLASQTCQQLFGHPRLGCSHDLPAQLDEFVERTGGALGTAEEIAYDHTILSYYLPHRPPSDAANALATVCSGGIGGLKARLGLLASRFGAAHPMKACRSCMAEDQERFGVAYWHVEHQHPGVWICRRHREILVRALGKVNGEGRFNWYLPESMQFVPGLDGEVSERELNVIDAAAGFGCGLSGLGPGFFLDATIVNEVYRLQMVEMGLTETSGRLKQRDFASTVLPVSTALGRLHELCSLPSTDDDVLTQFARLARNPRSLTHPMRHCILVIALFGQWESFFYKYQQQMDQAEPTAVDATDLTTAGQPAANDPRRQQVLAALDEGSAPTAAALVAGVSVATALVWASAAGYAVSRRPKVLSQEKRAAAIRKLGAGKSKEAVARWVGVSIQTITLLLRSEPGLSERWHQARFARAQRVARHLWDRTARAMIAPTATQLRKCQPAVFAWLYRNDRAWLNAYASRLEQVQKSNHANVHWDERDEAMAQSVRIAALSLLEQQPTRPIKLAQLCDLVPHLKARLSSIDRLPLTQTAIAEATRRHSKG